MKRQCNILFRRLASTKSLALGIIYCDYKARIFVSTIIHGPRTEKIKNLLSYSDYNIKVKMIIPQIILTKIARLAE